MIRGRPLGKCGRGPLVIDHARTRRYCILEPRRLDYVYVFSHPVHRMRSSTFGNGIFVTISFALLCSRGARAQDGKHSPTGNWNLKHSCEELLLEPTALVIARGDPHFLSSGKCTPTSDMTRTAGTFEIFNRESIPLSSITAIVKELVTRRPVQEAIHQTISELEPENMLRTAEGAGEGAILLPAYPAIILSAAGAMAPFRGVKTRIESVRILWTENGTPRSKNFLLSGKDVESLLKHLAEVTGKSWVELRFDSEARNEDASQVLVHFSQEFSAGNFTVWAGNYRFLMLTTSAATHLVYFFSEGKQMPQDAMAVFAAEASPLGAGKPWKIRLARNVDSSWCLSEIDTDVEHLRVRACPEATAPAPQL